MMQSWVAPDLRQTVVVRNSILEVIAEGDDSVPKCLMDGFASRRCRSCPPIVNPQKNVTMCWPPEDTGDDSIRYCSSEDMPVMQSLAKDNGKTLRWQCQDEDASTVWLTKGAVTYHPPEDEEACIMPTLPHDGHLLKDEDACITPTLPNERVWAMATEPSKASTGHPQFSENSQSKNPANGSRGQRPNNNRLCKMKRERIKKLAERLLANGTSLEDANLSEEMRANAFIMKKLKGRLAQARADISSQACRRRSTQACMDTQVHAQKCAARRECAYKAQANPTKGVVTNMSFQRAMLLVPIAPRVPWPHGLAESHTGTLRS